MRTYDVLNGGTVARLARYRREAADPNSRPGPWKNWRYWRNRGHVIGTAHAPTPFCDGRAANVPLELADGWRDVGDADNLADIRHKGWYSDADNFEVYRGHVWQLPARDGEPRYIAGYLEVEGRDGVTSGYCVIEWPLYFYSDKRAAAIAADELARVMAEKARDYSERWKEASEASDRRDELRDELRDAREKARECVKAFRDAGGTLPESAAVIVAERFNLARANMRAAIKGIAECRDKIENLGMAGEF